VSRPYQKLLHFNAPGIAGTAAGDLSMAVFETMRDRFPETRSNVTIRQINDLLDELVAIKNPFKTTHDWRSSSRAGGLLPPQKKKNNPVLRRKWAEKLIRMGLHFFAIPPLYATSKRKTKSVDKLIMVVTWMNPSPRLCLVIPFHQCYPAKHHLQWP
jgi:hypothetical protein